MVLSHHAARLETQLDSTRLEWRARHRVSATDRLPEPPPPPPTALYDPACSCRQSIVADALNRLGSLCELRSRPERHHKRVTIPPPRTCIRDLQSAAEAIGVQ